ncbi:MAG: hypothetical protein AVDCRST_MAG70-609 [uncultured Thermomicrobiales bacterium]|uniref:Uncharacterized protein n=1 Tax=uncultured Thermomicrobiales bacterium TaxID=1645740 RepID=A0A6J4UFW8_9BACT|nr:MAG: hypothetical protein AVDCRST_MAG70-609 [uncultured Thermomicrobiales bacterium]
MMTEASLSGAGRRTAYSCPRRSSRMTVPPARADPRPPAKDPR